ncbi:MAG: hypothetical protein HYW80_01780 [Parcubacteria group bacterium]|nr:hypothetical protein [Parcubacteria group bacterium]
MPLKFFAIFLALILALGSAYSLYFLVVCENHALAHSFLGAACPRTNFLEFLTTWNQTFVTITKAVFVGVFLIALFLKFKVAFNLGALLASRQPLWLDAKSSEGKTNLPLLQFIFQGKLHPQVYNA